MPLRVGFNGAIVKPPASTMGQRHARNIPSKAVDLTGGSTDKSTDEVSDNNPGEEEESTDTSDRDRGHQSPIAGRQGRNAGADQATIGRQRINHHQQVEHGNQGYTVEESYIVTSVHHRPWGAGDDFTTVGVFPTEVEAQAAANEDYQGYSNYADGWEEEWSRSPGDGMLQLRGRIEEYEDDTATYTASIKLEQRQRPVAVQPRVPSAVLREVEEYKPRLVYIVKEEERRNVETPDDLGDLHSVVIHRIFVKLDDANDFARDFHDNLVKNRVGHGDTVGCVLRNKMTKILITDINQQTAYFIDVEKKLLI